MSQRGSITHESHNGFNALEVSHYLQENYEKSLAEAQTNKNISKFLRYIIIALDANHFLAVYKPTSGSWTSGKSASGAGLTAKTNSILHELTKSLRTPNEGGRPQGGNQGREGNNQQQKQRKQSRS